MRHMRRLAYQMCRRLTQTREFSYLGAILILFLWSSCSSALAPPSEKEKEISDAAMEALTQVPLEEITRVFDQLPKWSYTRHDRTENRGSSTYDSFTYLMELDTSDSLITISGPDSSITTDLSGILEFIIPKEIPYLMKRFQDQFLYRIQEDTSYWARPAYEIAISARPGSKQDIRMASHVFDTASNQLVSANFHHYSRSILFEESSRYQLQLRPIGNRWVPYRLNLSVTLRLPYGQKQVYSRNVTFYNYRSWSSD